MNERLLELTKDRDFLQRMIEAESPEQLGLLFKRYEIELENLSIEEAFKLVREQENAELNENELEDVSGGLIGVATAIGAGATLIVGGVAVCFLAGVAWQIGKSAYNQYKSSKG